MSATRDRKQGDVVLTIRPDPQGLDGHGCTPNDRLRQLLKRMLRTWGWRCVRMQEVDGDVSEA